MRHFLDANPLLWVPLCPTLSYPLDALRLTRLQSLPGLMGRLPVNGLVGRKGDKRREAHSAHSAQAGARPQWTEPALGQEGGSWSLLLHGDGEKEGKAQMGPQEPCLAGCLPAPDRAPGAALLCRSCFLLCFLFSPTRDTLIAQK